MSNEKLRSTPGITVLYGTETGNCMRVSKQLWEQLAAAGVPARWLNTGKYRLQELTQERCLLVAISTYDDEEPPEDALVFMGFLTSKNAPRLPQLSYGVLALGATCYSAYCTVGIALDARLAELGATRLVDIGLCDMDFEAAASAWIARAVPLVHKQFGVA
ncbi:MAG: flavodoxin domain-containing protein [Gammaproteobacteria bacterium]